MKWCNNRKKVCEKYPSHTLQALEALRFPRFLKRAFSGVVFPPRFRPDLPGF
nr:MAG TPA: hypothetical protein [Caudoviricetes sp.]